MVACTPEHSFGEPMSFENTDTQGFANTQLQDTREDIESTAGRRAAKDPKTAR